MINRFNDNLLMIRNLCESLRILSQRALEDANDDSCRALYTDMNKEMALYLEEIDKEIDGHKKKGKWE